MTVVMPGVAVSIIPQTDSLQAVVADDDIAVIAGSTNTPLALGKTDLAVVTS